jgi:DNA invertase Pin-like site-specific DNA recombinase
MEAMMRVALYLRVSTKGVKNGKEQTVENQRRKLLEIAAAHDWEVVREFTDTVSGAKGERNRPGFRAMLEAAQGRDFDAVCVWALDRFSREGIGRTFSHLQRLHRHKVRFYSKSEPFLSTVFHEDGEMGELLLSLFAFIAGFERKRIVERIHAGLERARAEGTTLGRPCKVFRRGQVAALREQGLSLREIASKLGVSKGTVQNVLAAAGGAAA